MEAHQSLTLAIVWQLMRAYTLALLSRLGAGVGALVTEAEIVDWANRRAGTSVNNFQDKSLRSSEPILKLIDTLQPGTVDWSLVGEEEDRFLSNAKYAVTSARRIGAPVYALPEDIVAGRHKMIMTVFASLMLTDMDGN